MSKHYNKGLSLPDSLLYTAIQNSGGVPYHLVFDPESGEGNYLFVGEGISRLLGIPTPEISEKLFQSLIEQIVPLSNKKPTDLRDTIEKYKKGELESYKAEILIRTAEGETIWFLDSSVVTKEYETGRVTGAFGILFDINERKKIYEKLERARLKVNEVDHFKSTFLRNISHEIRTPLNAIVGFSALLSDSCHSDPTLNSYIDTIINSSNHLLAVLTDIIHISNIDANNIKISSNRVVINSILRSLYDQFLPEVLERGIRLKLEFGLPDEESFTVTDNNKLVQIISNLLSNAFKFTQQGLIKFGYEVNDKWFEFFVSDTGIGIPEIHHKRIFEPFYQVENTYTKHYDGTGVGLTISKAYVELLGGEIWLSSTLGLGSTFNFTIPRIKNVNPTQEFSRMNNVMSPGFKVNRQF